MRRFLSPRWLALHALALVSGGGCLALAWWQLHRAESGNWLSWGYTFQWPAFGAFAIFLWIRMIRDARRGTGVAGRTGPDGAASPGDRPAGAGRAPAGTAEPERIRRIERVVPTVPAGGDDGDAELVAYNRYLAWLSANPHRSPAEYPG